MRITGLICVLMCAGTAGASTPPKNTARLEAEFTERYRLGLRHMHNREWQQAEAAFSEALTYRDSPDAQRMSRTCRFNLDLQRGAKALRDGSYGLAVAHYKSSLEVDPRSTAAIEGLRSAQYQAAFRDGMSALARHSTERARSLFDRCLELRPGDRAARFQLNLLDVAARQTDDWRARWRELNGCLETEDASCLDRQAIMLADLSNAAEPGDAHNDGLLPALLCYARGDLNGAAKIARNLSGPAALRFSSIVRAKLRRRLTKELAPYSAGLYGLTLLAGMYFGIRGVRVRQLATPA